METKFNKNLREIEYSKSIRHCEDCLTNLSTYEEQFHFFGKLYPYFFKKAFQDFTKHPQIIGGIIEEGFEIILRILFQQEYHITFEKNGVHETKVLHLVKESFIMKDFLEVYYPIVQTEPNQGYIPERDFDKTSGTAISRESTNNFQEIVL